MMRRTQMRTISPKRLAEFQALGIRPASTLTAPKARRYTDTGPDAATVEKIWARDGGKCVPCGDQLYWPARGHQWSVSHRKLRSQGGDNRLSNLMLSCGNGTQGCEGLIHAHPERARDAGWMVRRNEDPAAKPVEHSQHGHVLLLDDGGWTRVEAEVIPREDSDEHHPF